MRTLIVEDALDYATLIARHLGAVGFVSDHASDIAQAEAALAANFYDIMVLDRRLPDGDAISALRRFRLRQPGLRVLMLTALDSIDDRVGGLEAGADDYVLKTTPVNELIARVRACARRPAGNLPETLTCGALSFDPIAREASVAGAPVPLRRLELVLLEALISRAGHVMTRDNLDARLYSSDDFVQPNALDAQVSRLRRKLLAARADVLILNIRGVGYMLAAA